MSKYDELNGAVRDWTDEKHLIALVAERSVETAVLNLLDNNCMIFPREQIISQEVIRKRSSKELEAYLQEFDYGDCQLTVIRVLDSKIENYKSTRWSNKFLKESDGGLRVINIRTSPEIEMLYILQEGCLKDYERFISNKKGKKNPAKPSTYCKEVLFKKRGNFKQRQFAETYFTPVPRLLDAITEYHRIRADKDSLDLYSLLKEKFK